MITALECINAKQLHKKYSALVSFHLSSAIPDLALSRIGIKNSAYCNKNIKKANHMDWLCKYVRILIS
ncbi:hypothetical protein CWC15_11085 [Pseudoalteromonas spongiae]|nr:hypothetical protein CWC15_11085 [Pseudoalteromonas spongiae]